jgi:hypothetical protein
MDVTWSKGQGKGGCDETFQTVAHMAIRELIDGDR